MASNTAPSGFSSEKPISVHENEHQVLDHTVALHKVNSRLAHPLAGYSHAQLIEMGAAYARNHEMAHLQEEFSKGAMLAQDPGAFETLPLLTDEDRNILRREITHKWSHPKQLYHLVVMCSLAAATQGMGMFAPSISFTRFQPIIFAWYQKANTT